MKGNRRQWACLAERKQIVDKYDVTRQSSDAGIASIKEAKQWFIIRFIRNCSHNQTQIKFGCHKQHPIFENDQLADTTLCLLYKYQILALLIYNILADSSLFLCQTSSGQMLTTVRIQQTIQNVQQFFPPFLSVYTCKNNKQDSYPQIKGSEFARSKGQELLRRKVFFPCEM